jgi:hypothetical protein
MGRHSIGIWGGLGAALLAATVWALLGRISVFQLEQGRTDGSVLEARQGIGQTFASHYPGLQEIRVLAMNAAQADLDSVQLRLRLLTPEGSVGPDIRTSTPTATAANWVRFPFEPVDDSAGQSYIFIVEGPGARPPLLAAHQQDMYPEGQLVSSPGGDLVFAAHYQGRPIPTARALLGELTKHRPGLFGRAWFYIAVLAAWVVTLAGASVHLWRLALGRAATDEVDCR